ncbi:MAG: D-alanyl-D-alanine carboxypeptidase [Solirubrobacterales bacterium]|nr:D-alanyl-D-alanine carboxypeptidase [Solirubrobacterales bacterium]
MAVSRLAGPAARRTLWLTLAICFVSLAFAAGSPGAKAKESGKPPKLDAKAWIAIDARTGEPVAENKADKRLPMASTTKLMTAYLAMRRLTLRKKVPATNYQGIPGESLMGLEVGQKVSVRDLLYGLVLLSGNDAAVTLAKAVSGTEPRFVALMNATAVKLGLTNTHYNNPIGLDGKSHYTSARDLASLSRTLMEMPRFRQIASSRTAKLRSYDPPLEIETINHFVLNNSWARGIKTGHTDKAGYVLASDGRKRATELIGAVIGTPTETSRDVETVKLLDYGFSRYRKRVPVLPDRAVVKVPVKYEDAGLALVSKRPIPIGLRKGEQAKVTTVVPGEVEGPIKEGQRIGRAAVSVDGDLIDTVPLFAAQAVEKPSLIDKATDNILLLVIALMVVVFAILAVVAFVRRRRQSRMRRRLRRVTRYPG